MKLKRQTDCIVYVSGTDGVNETRRFLEYAYPDDLVIVTKGNGDSWFVQADRWLRWSVPARGFRHVHDAVKLSY